ncbi:hypothetical protein F4677DRAFT_420659 [Hypoxylon crocopeplum]|nr:hypothetical protein F4677DRAFT_420659 [Hypoxylon crocopeplum]
MTTGEAIVFLKIDWVDPTILYYHLSEPKEEVRAHPDNLCYCTAVGQVLAFSLIVLGSLGQRHNHEQRDREVAVNSLKRWNVYLDAILRSIKTDKQKTPPCTIGYVPTTYEKVDRTPRVFNVRNARRRLTYERDRPPDILDRSQNSESSDDESQTQSPVTPSLARSTHPARGVNGGGDNGSGGSKGGNERHNQQGPIRGNDTRDSHLHQYCTQKCLLGLVEGTCLDDNCSNVASHQRQKSGNHHPVTHSEWLQLLKEQFRRTLDDGMMPLGKQGAGGALFQVTLLGYDYTFVSKGTDPEFVQDLEHESTVYRRLGPLQGVSVSVALGSIDLRDNSQIYYYDFRARIVYMMLLSWGGQSLDSLTNFDSKEDNLGQELVQSVRELHSMGVAHTDVRMPNMLWNQENGRLMMIDFERALLMDSPRLPLAEVMPNKRIRTLPRTEPGKLPASSSFDASYKQQAKRNDILAAESIFIF